MWSTDKRGGRTARHIDRDVLTSETTCNKGVSVSAVIEPYKLYDTDELAEIFSSHRQSIYQDRIKIPEPVKISDGERGKRWLGLSIINFLHGLAGLPPISPIELLTGGVAGSRPALLTQSQEDDVERPRRERAIRLPKRKKKAAA
jgi:hypothetical protein